MKTLVWVGSNIGKDVSDAVEWHDVAILFEPLPEVVAALREQFGSPRWRHKCVVVIPAACWSLAGRFPFNIYMQKNGLASSLGTVTDQAASFYGGEKGYDLQLRAKIEVNCVRLCDYMPEFVETLIVDAQGADLAILQTVEPWLRQRRICSVIVECDGPEFRHYDGLGDNSESALLDFMRSCGYDGERDNRTLRQNPDWNFWPRSE